MSETDFGAVDEYIAELLVEDDPALKGALAASEAAGLPQINVAPNQGKLLMLLAQAIRARKILEIGTLGGYSTIWLARALPPGGHLVTLEANPSYPRSPTPILPELDSQASSRSAWVQPAILCRASPGKLRSISSSSMPISRARPTISNGE